MEKLKSFFANERSEIKFVIKILLTLITLNYLCMFIISHFFPDIKYLDNINAVIGCIYFCAFGWFLFMFFIPYLIKYIIANQNTVRAHGRTGSGEHVYVDIPVENKYPLETPTLRKNEKYFIFGWFFGLMIVVLLLIAPLIYLIKSHMTNNTDSGLFFKTGNPTLDFSFNAIIITIFVIGILGIPMFCTWFIIKKDLRKKFYSFAVALLIAYFISINSLT